MIPHPKAGGLGPTISAPPALVDREAVARAALAFDTAVEEYWEGHITGTADAARLDGVRAILALAHPGSVAPKTFDLIRQARQAASAERALYGDSKDAGDLYDELADALGDASRVVAPTSGERDHETAASRDVLAERRRQIEAEGYTTAHDDEHDKGEIARAAACYARIASDWDNYAFPEGCPADWPWSPVYWKWTDPRRDLVKAGALILAEIERLDLAVPPPASRNEGERP